MKPSTFKKYCRVIDEYLANGQVGNLAYIAIYPNANQRHAEKQFRRIMAKPKVKQYYQQRQAELDARASEKHELDFDEMIMPLKDQFINFRRLQELAQKSATEMLTPKEINEFELLLKAAPPNAYVRTIEVLGKLFGRFEKDNEQKKNEVAFQFIEQPFDPKEHKDQVKGKVGEDM